MSFARQYDHLGSKEIGQRALRAVQNAPPSGDTDKQYEQQRIQLIEFFSAVDLSSYPALTACALSVYGWMPTIPKNLLEHSNVAGLQRELMELQAGSLDKPTEFNFVNGSVVGTSNFCISCAQIASRYGTSTLLRE